MMLQMDIDGNSRQGVYYELEKAWTELDEDSIPTEEDDLVRLLDYKLAESVSRQLVSDVPVGVLLSGGLDSSVLLSLMQDKVKDQVQAFSYAFEEQGASSIRMA